MNMIEGSPSGEGRRFGLVVARFNHFVTEPLLEGAVAGLKEHGVRDEDLTVVRVPGTFELPPVALRMARSGRFDAIIMLGVLEFIKEPGEVAKEARRVLCQGGFFGLSVPLRVNLTVEEELGVQTFVPGEVEAAIEKSKEAEAAE